MAQSVGRGYNLTTYGNSNGMVKLAGTCYITVKLLLNIDA